MPPALTWQSGTRTALVLHAAWFFFLCKALDAVKSSGHHLKRHGEVVSVMIRPNSSDTPLGKLVDAEVIGAANGPLEGLR